MDLTPHSLGPMDLCVVQGVFDEWGKNVLVPPIAVMELVLNVNGVKELAVHVVTYVP